MRHSFHFTWNHIRTQELAHARIMNDVLETMLFKKDPHLGPKLILSLIIIALKCIVCSVIFDFQKLSLYNNFQH